MELYARLCNDTLVWKYKLVSNIKCQQKTIGTWSKKLSVWWGEFTEKIRLKPDAYANDKMKNYSWESEQHENILAVWG